MYYVVEVKEEGYVEHPKSYNYKSSNSIASFNRYIWEHIDFPSFTPDLTLQMVKEKKYSTLNDFLFYSNKGFLLSPKVKEIFQSFRLPSHKFYPARVIRNHKEYTYYYFYFFADSLQSIDFKASKFYFINDLEERVNFSVDSLEAFSQLKQTNWANKEQYKEFTDPHGFPKVGTKKMDIEARRKIIRQFGAYEIVFGDMFNKEQDLFTIHEFSWMTYISERLKDALLLEKVTGIIFSAIAERQYVIERVNPLIKWEE